MGMQHYRRFRGHEITVERESRAANWYIRVTDPGGYKLYDGWWRDSAGKTVNEAFAEAKRGALLVKPAVQPQGEKTP